MEETVMCYTTLVAEHPPRVIRNARDYELALAVIDELMGRELDPEETDYLDTLTTLVEAYESAHHDINISDIDGIESLKFLLEQNDMSDSDLGRLLGNRTLGPAILGRKSELSKANIRALCEHFTVSADLFMR